MQDREDGKEDVVKSLIASTSVTRITNENVHKGLNHVKKKTDVRTRQRSVLVVLGRVDVDDTLRDARRSDPLSVVARLRAELDSALRVDRPDVEVTDGDHLGLNVRYERPAGDGSSDGPGPQAVGRVVTVLEKAEPRIHSVYFVRFRRAVNVIERNFTLSGGATLWKIGVNSRPRARQYAGPHPTAYARVSGTVRETVQVLLTDGDLF
jgi:hypothetical protein